MMNWMASGAQNHAVVVASLAQLHVVMTNFYTVVLVHQVHEYPHCVHLAQVPIKSKIRHILIAFFG